MKEVCRHYDIKNERLVYKWLKKYGNDSKTVKVVRVIMKSEQERIRELESVVADLSVKCKLFKAQVDIYEEVTGSESKKKLSMEQLQELEKKKKKLSELGL